ncbi:MAG: hypothetical protein HYV29_05210 [Ignavibacteriales bacterium]|nr:hypothetical protein [Ignavibacteriales bacterium]
MLSALRFVLLIFIASTTLPAQQLTAEKILQNVKANFDKVQDYSVILDIKPNMERFRAKEMRLILFFKQPNKIHVESKNFVMIPKQLFEINPSDLISKFDGILIGKEERNGMTTHKLRLISKPEKGRPPRESYIWIDPVRWVVVHFESTPAEGRNVVVNFEYTTVDGKYYLPSAMKASFDFEQNLDSLAERVYSPNRIPRKGTVDIFYSEYKVNQGLSDEIFEKKKKEPEK